jgi:hypothetical protein
MLETEWQKVQPLERSQRCQWSQAGEHIAVGQVDDLQACEGAEGAEVAHLAAAGHVQLCEASQSAQWDEGCQLITIIQPQLPEGCQGADGVDLGQGVAVPNDQNLQPGEGGDRLQAGHLAAGW